MACPVAERADRLPLYSGTVVTSLRLGVILLCGLMASGCAVSGGMGNLFAKGKASDTPAQASVQGNVQGNAQGSVHATALANEEVTGSTNAPTLRASAAVATSGLPSETDLVFARMAIVEVLKRGSKEVSAPWENPSSGARGTVTPIANAYARDGQTCHDFLASYIRRGSPESWMQGQACRAHKRDAWEVRSLRPWTRS
jgi:surface antigen